MIRLYPSFRVFLRELYRVGRTSAFRYSILFTGAFSVLTGISMVMIYQTAEQEISQQIDSHLYSESVRLQRVIQYRRTMDIRSPMVGVTERVATEQYMSYCMVPQDKLPPRYRMNASQNFAFFDGNFDALCDLRVGSDRKSNQMRIIVASIDSKYALVTGYDTRSQTRLLASMLNIAYMVTAMLLAASFIGSFMMARTITHSIYRITSTARRIVDGDFSERIHTTAKDSDELSKLADNLNHMLERIENLITSQRQVTNNIAHDLRSPLNRLRNRMEVALLDKNIGCEQLEEVIAESVKDADNLLKTFNALLNIAQVESRAKDDFTDVSISAVGEDLAELYEVLTEEGEHSFSADIAQQLHVMGNRQLIAQAIINLLDNAVKYTQKGGHISLSVKRDGNHIVISVADNGPGIPKDKRQDVLKRFVRLDSARSTSGNGLGLSLVSAVASLHNGQVLLHDNHPGLNIELRLPDMALYQLQQKQKKRAKKIKTLV